MNINIQPVKPAMSIRCHVIVDGHETNRHGPYVDADAAEAMARRLLQFGRALTSGGKRG